MSNVRRWTVYHDSIYYLASASGIDTEVLIKVSLQDKQVSDIFEINITGSANQHSLSFNPNNDNIIYPRLEELNCGRVPASDVIGAIFCGSTTVPG